MMMVTNQVERSRVGEMRRWADRIPGSVGGGL
jgi:hypothetical protein